MITKEELQDGIAVCKAGEPTPEKMIRLGAYYTVMEHLFGEEKPALTYSMQSAPQEQAETLDTSGSSDFLLAVHGKDSGRIMDVMDELMDTLKIIQPRIYGTVMRKVSEIK